MVSKDARMRNRERNLIEPTKQEELTMFESPVKNVVCPPKADNTNRQMVWVENKSCACLGHFMIKNKE